MAVGESKINVVHLYPREMNIYGDTGNVRVALWRLKQYGYTPELTLVGVGDKLPKETDLLICGGGQDSGQITVQKDLQKQKATLRAMVEDGLVVLSVCGTYQLFGHYFKTHRGEEIQGVGIFDAQTDAGDDRLIGNVVVGSPFGRLVGFENHSGRTSLNEGQLPLGKVTKGFGNDAKSGKEGAVHRNAFGTYLHGPLLPKNPRFADELLRRAVERRYGRKLEGEIDDSVAELAARIAAKRP